MKITLPDNSSRELPEGSSGYDLAKLLDQALRKDPLSSPSNLQEDLRLDAESNFCKVIAEAIKM